MSLRCGLMNKTRHARFLIYRTGTGVGGVGWGESEFE